MKIDQDEYRARMSRFEDVFRRSGAKMTHQRIEIFREVARTREHPDAETIFRRVRKRIPTISPDTVYRTLWMLMAMRLITTLGTRHERVRFDANTSAHHHFICSECGLARDVQHEELDNLPVPEDVGDLGRVETTHVEFRGICSRCARDMKHT